MVHNVVNGLTHTHIHTHAHVYYRTQELGDVYVIFIIAEGWVNITRPEDIKVRLLCQFHYRIALKFRGT